MNQNLKSRPIINEKGQVLNDKELIDQACKDIQDYEEKTGTPAPVDPKFKEFLFEMNEACSTPAEVVAYKKAHVLQTMDYDLVVDNTIKKIAKEEKENKEAFL